ncbi:MAG TPA: HEAT repeat domain-containing protein [Trichormus sp. M33_DOE_039]|nr:HEAT repeat domain-containing protein [Trichormus sp. M33_DOE_039]
MLKNARKYPIAMLTTLAFIGTVISTNTQAIAQTSLTQPQCTELKIQEHIQKLNQGDPADFNTLVACKSKAVPSLIKGLNSLDENLRITIIAALGEIGLEASPAVPLLNNLLNNKSKDVRVIAAHALKKIGKDPVPALIRALGNTSPTIREEAADALGRLGIEAKEAVPTLINALQDSDSGVRAHAADALGEIGTQAKDVIPALTNALKDPDNNVRVYAAYALGEFGMEAEAKEAVPVLTNALQDPNRNFVAHVAYALSKIEDHVLSLILALQNPDPQVRAQAADTLGKLGRYAEDAYPDLFEDAYLALNNARKDPDSYVRDRVAYAIISLQERVATSVFLVKEATSTHVSNNLPIMCKIPVIRSVLRWKCPSVVRLNSNGK